MTATAETLTPGTPVWSRELQPGIVCGDWVRAEYGVAAGELSGPPC